MKKIDFKTLILTCIFCLLPILIGLWQYDALPDKVAIHFDINNNPDNYFNKSLFVFGMPIFMAILEAICSIAVDLTDKHKEANKKVTMVMKWMIPVILVVMYIITIAYNLGTKLDIRVWVMLLLGAMFIITGNYLPKTVGTNKWPQKKFTESVQKRINRIGGYVMIVYGLMFILSVFFPPLISVLVLVFLIIFLIALTIYGFALDKKERAAKAQNKEK